MYSLETFIKNIELNLLPQFNIESITPHDPIAVHFTPVPWILLGAGNYAAAVYDPSFPDFVVKVYAPGRPGLKEEVEVYSKIGMHPAYSSCVYHGENYLVLIRLKGTTLYDCLKQGIQIPKQAIFDIDSAMKYARKKGLYPHDVHAKNVMVINGRGAIVDISDFYKDEYCSLWHDIKKAYYKIYLPLWYKHHLPLPDFLLNAIRKMYRFYKKFRNHH